MVKARNLILGAVAAVVVLAAVSSSVVLGRLPAASVTTPQPAISEGEHKATLAALQPPKRTRPVVAIIGINDATETTDYLMPYGVLKRADVAEVVSVATQAGPVTLYPALKVEPDATTAEFDQKYPDGADYVVIPAMSRNDDPAALAWIKAQEAGGATIIAVCVGVEVAATAGLLEGKRGTTHWYVLKNVQKAVPSLTYVADRRFVIDGNIMTTTGITASMPAMLTLIEAIAGHDRAAAVALDLGVANWDARHDSGAFKVTRPFATTVIGNLVAFWNREELGIELTEGMDEVGLALLADAWSRTYRSQAVSFSSTEAAVTTRNGLRILPDRVATSWPSDRTIPPQTGTPWSEWDAALVEMAKRYGAPTADVVAMQLEYPRQPSPAAR
jgi:putative intracellular protease/amidase